jgi:hypothetical protein
MKNKSNKPKKGEDYIICGKESICDLCMDVRFNEIGKCGMMKTERPYRLSDIALRVEGNRNDLI